MTFRNISMIYSLRASWARSFPLSTLFLSYLYSVKVETVTNNAKTIRHIAVTELKPGMHIASRDRLGELTTKKPTLVQSITGPHEGALGSCKGYHVNRTLCYSHIGRIGIVVDWDWWEEMHSPIPNGPIVQIAEGITL